MRDLAFRLLFALCLVLAVPLAAMAQESAAEISQQVEDDKGFITRFLQEKLSGAGRQVTIDGFQGALSSRATFDRMTIADDHGVWITLENGIMSWSRSALLSRRVQIDELSAGRVILARLPGSGESAPQAEAREFSLPQLPIGVSIDKIQIGRVELGQAIIGQEAVIAIDGSMNLENGEGVTKLTIDRVDGPRGRFQLDAGFSNETRVLALDLKLDEDRNGLFTNIIKMNGRPAVQAQISGTGPLSDYRARIALTADGQPRVQGNVSVRAEPRDGAPGTAFLAQLDGDIATLTSPQNQQFFAGQSRIRAEGWRGSDGRLLVPELKVTTGALDLAGSVATTAKGAPESAHLTLLLGKDAGATQLPVAVPFGDKPMTVTSGNLRLDYDAAKGAGWELQGRVGDLTRPDLSLSEMRLDGRGRVLLTAEQALAEVRGWVAFGMDDVKPADPGLAEALGEVLNGGLNFAFTPGNALKFWGMNINGKGYGFKGDAELSGLKSGLAISGDITATHEDIGHFSRLAGRALGGRAEAAIKGRYVLLGDAFDLDTRVKGHDIRIGQQQADRMLKGESTIDLSAKRDRTGIQLRRLVVNAQNLTAEAQGYLNSRSSDVTAVISMPDLSVADPHYAGAVQTRLQVTGPQGGRKLTLDGKAQDLAMGRPEIDGAFKGETDLVIGLLESAGSYQLQQFSLRNPQLDAQGRGSFSMEALDGELSLTMPDLSALGRGFSGGVVLQGTASRQGNVRRIELTGSGTDLRFGQHGVDGALPGNTGLRLAAREQGGEFTIDSFNLQNQQMQATAQGTIGKQTDMTGMLNVKSLASFGRGWRGSLDVQGSFRDAGEGTRRLDVTGTGSDLSFGQAQVDGALAGRTALAVQGIERGGVFSIDRAVIENPRLNLGASGSIGKGATDLTANLRADDLRFLGRGFRGAVQVQGRVQDQQDGSRTITAGVAARNIAIGNAKADAVLAGQTEIDLVATQHADGSLTVSRLRAKNPQLSVTGDGSPTEGLNLHAVLADLGQLVQGFPGPATLKGTIRNAGPNYDMDLTATGPGDTRARATGTIANSLARADIHVTGSSDAAAANPFLRTRSVEGPLSFDLRLNGKPALESLSGRVSLSDGRLAEPRFGLAVKNLNAKADFNAGRIDVDVRGAVEAGGTITVSGPVHLTGSRQMELGVRLNNVVLRDPHLYEIRVNGAVSVAGIVGEGPLVSGRIDLGHTELRIPSTGLGGARAIPDMIHRSERPPQRQTRAKAGLLEFPSPDAIAAGMTSPPATPPAKPARFDLLISAPDQVFVRGRGVDAELGGEIRLTGNARQPIPIGKFELIRGRVDLLGKRFDMTEGLIELQGSLIPVIRLVAETQQDDITTQIIIDGEAHDPEITFESSPEMPQEEVLSQLLFGRGLDNISALQAAQLASAVATLAGTGGESIIGRLRASAGLDDLDLATDDQGNVSVRAGKYLSKNVYTDVQVGDDGKTQLNLNLDVNKALTARGSVDSEGESTIGLFYERDY
jgi:translocation and assembly module TamB